ncbi:hypothetical protein LX64_04919 [Chitinophaga skermanii]|uniref:Uncharacterized protein n=1 Tax=Chitinophaga skermanii TaxID=331697 RepID=A0A327Q0N2_9BACT|nr:DUF6607 family protein [Chitinophaga skermanii]RAI97869.1 hypothetical protein LX64_04919 [Chitinophaga skermanii]
MNKTSILTLATAFMAVGAFAQQKDKLAQDKAAIKNMCGCMDVTFEYTETFPTDSNYKPKGYHKTDGALEYVTVVEDKNNRIILQHLLLAGGEVIKHWTEDWQYENRNLLVYNKDQQWKNITLPAADVKGQWTQKVFGVDDEPRYEGSATWVHADGRHYWESTSDAPLPRREYTTRNDYNVLTRTNHHEITNWGSVHEQDNLKVVRKDGEKDVTIVGEKGVNSYRRVEESKCQKAKDWWQNNQQFWALVRRGWEKLYGENNTITLERKVNDKSLYSVMNTLEKKALNKEIAGAALETEINTTLKAFAAANKDLTIKR